LLINNKQASKHTSVVHTTTEQYMVSNTITKSSIRCLWTKLLSR